jgi:glycosyltransferase involved in cell wall biosynthesis
MAGLAPPVRPREHFLYVGDDEPRKNVLVLLAAYAEYRGLDHEPVPLILAGAATAVATGVIEERSPSRERLAELYAGAVALVHPSLYEGFGMTALEAMSVGAPVIAADSPGLRETCGDAAVYADPHSPSSFASAMARIARDETAGDDLAERGRARAGEFSWARSARAHVEAYSLAASRR